MRVPVIAGNWKMHKTVGEAVRLVQDLKEALSAHPLPDVEIVVCPPFTALAAVHAELRGSRIRLGAQDVFWEKEGAFTGAISPGMLREAGCSHTIIGHSERRRYFGETDETVNKKVKAALNHGLIPIVCVGETLEQRDAGQTDELVRSQVQAAFAGLTPVHMAEVIIAYEPIWAIGTGRTAEASEANRVIGLIRQQVAESFSEDTASAVRILYGGSVNPENIDELMAQPEIDGALVGGASLDAASFARIVAFH
ncbi:MAG: triose-phosphate isomerase [Firmicutes bacterium]|nr:triose-phosphate isomerase [Bacillota bacterium]